MSRPTPARDDYESTTGILVERIRDLMTKDPRVALIDNVWDLHDVPGFFCSDLEPSMAQAREALARAKQLGPIKPKGE